MHDTELKLDPREKATITSILGRFYYVSIPGKYNRMNRFSNIRRDSVKTIAFNMMNFAIFVLDGNLENFGVDLFAGINTLNG